MNHSNNNVDNQCLLNIPIAYILEKKEVKEIEQSFDENGWNIMHYAIADLNIPKIKELIHFSFDWSLNGNRNYIPLNVYMFNEKKKPNRLKCLDKIPFCENGFSPIHLAVFLFNFYNKLSDEFFYQQIAEDYSKVISSIINGDKGLNSYVDRDGYSLFDYAFLLEDITLIERFQMLDPGFTSLKKVSASLGKQILSVMSIKNKNTGSIVGTYKKTNNNAYDDLSNALDKKILNDKLNNDLKVNQKQKKPIQKI